MKKTLTFLIGLFFLTATQATASTASTDSLPTAFMLGQYDGQPFERLKANYETQLLSVCKNDMETAYYLWVHVLKHIETQSVKAGFNLDGVKLWLYVFWNKDGTINNIAFHPKPNSKNVKNEDIANFLTAFCKTYKFPLTTEVNFSHYSTASFPVMVEKPTETATKANNKQ